MRLVWVTGVSGSGKSTTCRALKSIGVAAIDTDWDGFNHWVDHETGEPVVDPPYRRQPTGWTPTRGTSGPTSSERFATAFPG